MLRDNKGPLESRGCISTTVLYILIFLSFTAGMWYSLTAEPVPGITNVPAHTAWLQLGALALSTGLSIFKGIKQNQAAKDLEKINRRPEYRVSQGTRNNLLLAKAAANEGIAAEVQNNYLDELNLGTASALRNNLLYGRGNTNTNSVVRAYNEGINQLNAQDAEARRRNRQDVYAANEQVAEEERRIFQTEMDQYRDRANWAAQLRSAGNENIAAGIGGALSAVASGALKGSSQNNSTAETPFVAKAPAPVTAIPGMSINVRGLNAGLQSDYNNIVQNQLRRNNTLLTGNNYWSNVRLLR